MLHRSTDFRKVEHFATLSTGVPLPLQSNAVLICYLGKGKGMSVQCKRTLILSKLIMLGLLMKCFQFAFAKIENGSLPSVFSMNLYVATS